MVVRGTPGLLGSIALHAAVFAAAYYLYKPEPEELPTEVAATVDITLVSVGAVTDVRSNFLREAPEPPAAAPPPEEVPDDLLNAIPAEETVEGDNAAPPPPPSEPEPLQPEAVPLPQTEPPEDAKSETPQARRTPAAPAEEDPLAGLLGDASSLFGKGQPNTRRQRPDPPPDVPQEPDAPPPGSSDPTTKGAGDRTGATATVESLLISQIKLCWDTVADLPNPQRLLVTVRVKLNTDGTLSGQPELMKPSRPPIGDRPMNTAIERALTATRTCAPYRLPADSYDIWREITFVVGPEPS
jgi:hypothetical protein